MLESLEVQNLAVLERVSLELGPGLTALTGETGAGKSLLVDALLLLLGERAEGLLRPGADTLLVTAFFNGKSLSRRFSGGRSLARIEGEVVSLRELAEEASRYLAVHAQHAALALVGRRAQRSLLDTRVEPGLLERYRQTYAHYQALQEEVARLEAAARERERRVDVLRFQIREIEQAQLVPGEVERLQQEAERLRHLETLRARVSAAVVALSGEGDALGLVAQALREVRAAGRHDPHLESLGRDLEGALDGLRAVSRELEDYLEGLEADPGRLEEVEARLALIERLERKYGEGIPGILGFAEAAKRELESLEGAEERLLGLRAQAEQAWRDLHLLGRQLSEARAEVAGWLSEAATQEIRALGMPAARFRVALFPLESPGPDGLEDVQFLFSANPDLPEVPLEKAASGGELSRVMLALALLTGAEAETVVFDEVDAGVGGEAAWRVAERLARLAEGRQVLVVTHLPQIAARAQAHYRVVKEGGAVRVERVEGEERVRELARMLSGSYSEAALEHARELLAAARKTA
ncbi:MAG: DNA repair protein RecN [Meiothermus sp.]|uniref:DNA repair protein RecN n=1 Tax=Meiothermus sp. TaxID=1955249 RepID=UPI0025F8B29D|nr:DNA repair protein RecN [Meiothermus sp.]MCS7057858.1 DNA repair protein RecN [Meiothermus sp.]MCS7194266.1 DNA repair protein RecN [Meiothermus sp.]MDW8090800.1 DNA repair protein RecN [Meiothermus sp.]